jgi:hypothetical protein
VTDQPCSAIPTAPVPTSLLPCWVQTPLLRVKTHAAPTFPLSPGPPIMAVLPSAEGIYDYDPLAEDRMARLEGLRTHDGRILPLNIKSWITRTVQRLELVLAMIADIEVE